MRMKARTRRIDTLEGELAARRQLRQPAQGALQQPLFGFRLADPNQQSELSLGSVNPALMSGTVETYEVLNPGFWVSSR